MAKKTALQSWSEATDFDISLIYQKKCRKCQYRGMAGNIRICDYLLITGHMRGDSLDRCRKFKAGPQLQITGTMKQVDAEKKGRNAGYVTPQSPPATHLGVLLDDFMRKKGMNCNKLGEKMGFGSGNNIRKWRSGYYKPSKANVEKLSQIMMISVEELTAAIEMSPSVGGVS